MTRLDTLLSCRSVSILESETEALGGLTKNFMRSGGAIDINDNASISIRSRADGSVVWETSAPTNDGSESTREVVHTQSRQCGSFVVQTDDGWINSWLTDFAPQSGPVAIVSDNALMAQTVANTCRRYQRGACILATDVPEQLHAWLDHAARDGRVSSIIVAFVGPPHAQTFGPRARAIAKHVPVIVTGPGARTDGDPYLAHWLRSLGTIVAPDVDRATMIACTMADMDPPVALEAHVMSDTRIPGPATATMVSAAGFACTIEDLPDEWDAQVAAVGAALTDTRFDVIVAVLGEPTGNASAGLRALAEARSRHPEIPLIVITAGSNDWHRRAASILSSRRVPTLPLGSRIDAVLSALLGWERARQEHAGPSFNLADPHRIRRALSQLNRSARSGASAANSEEVHAAREELLAGLAVALTPTRRVAYVEDALVAAAELGYPVTISPQVPLTRHQPYPLDGVAATRSDDVRRAAEDALGAARRHAGLDGGLALRHHVVDAPEIFVQAQVHPAYGVTIHAQLGNAEGRWVAPISHQDVAEFVSASNLPERMQRMVCAALAQILWSYGACVAKHETLASLTTPLMVTPGGLVARWCVTRLIEDETTEDYA